MTTWTTKLNDEDYINYCLSDMKLMLDKFEKQEKEMIKGAKKAREALGLPRDTEFLAMSNITLLMLNSVWVEIFKLMRIELKITDLFPREWDGQIYVPLDFINLKFNEPNKFSFLLVKDLNKLVEDNSGWLKENGIHVK